MEMVVELILYRLVVKSNEMQLELDCGNPTNTMVS